MWPSGKPPLSDLTRQDEKLEALITDRLYIIQKKLGYRYTEDAILLFNFIKKRKPVPSVLEIGAGGGILSLLLAHEWQSCQIRAIEIQNELAEMGQRSIIYNRLQDRVVIERADLRNLNLPFAGQHYPLIMTNPPFFRLGEGRLPPNPTRRISRHEVACCFDDICRTVQKILMPTGKFIFIHIHRRLDEIRDTLNCNHLELVEIEGIRGKFLAVGVHKKKIAHNAERQSAFICGSDSQYAMNCIRHFHHQIRVFFLLENSSGDNKIRSGFHLFLSGLWGTDSAAHNQWDGDIFPHCPDHPFWHALFRSTSAVHIDQFHAQEFAG
ncbi:MAG: hypothetical protein B6244_08635 [Candidatus Cloacimonetes bacterium 4572_55]|nr:MAG: hypothetical protein B6244_08635 [Candidatus Cloacimonetes bacterium 4572_55]